MNPCIFLIPPKTHIQPPPSRSLMEKSTSPTEQQITLMTIIIIIAPCCCVNEMTTSSLVAVDVSRGGYLNRCERTLGADLAWALMPVLTLEESIACCLLGVCAERVVGFCVGEFFIF